MARFLTPAGGAVFGGYEGLRKGGIPGMIGGAAIGAGLGALSPAALTGAARVVWNPATQRFIVPAVTGGALQYDRDNKEQ